MSSNTSVGRGKKGSKFWIQTLVNLDHGQALTKAIQNQDKKIESIQWISPLISQNYQEFKMEKIKSEIDEVPRIKKEQLDFWPNNGPWWDGVGIAKIENKDTIILVEAKAHIKETFTKCSASSEKSIDKIKTAMKSTHSELSSNEYNEELWLNKYYQLANRLTFLVQLRKKGIKVKLLLLNIVDDPTHIGTSEEQWIKHYEEVFNDMIGKSEVLEDVIILNFKV